MPEPLARARELFESGQYARAKPLLQRLAARGGKGGREYEVCALLGVVHAKLGELGPARYYTEEALKSRPDDPAMLATLGNLLHNMGEPEAAIAALRRALALSPRYLETRLDLATALAIRFEFAAVRALCEEGLRLHPGEARLTTHLASCVLHLGRVEEAIRFQREAWGRNPGEIMLLNSLLPMLNYTDTVAPEEVFAAHVKYGELMERVLPAAPAPEVRRPDPERRLRVGLLSADLRSHSCAYFVAPLLEHLDRSRVEPVCYYTGDTEDAMSLRLRAMATREGLWRFTGASTERLIAQMREDRLDVLIELSGHTAGHTLSMLQRGMAPVQVTYLGYPNTTGLRTCGYRIVDSTTDPPGQSERWSVERLLRVDPCFLCYAPLEEPEEPGPPAMERRGFVTFCSFNALHKVSGSTLRAWARVMREVPGSRLLLKNSSLSEADVRASTSERLAAARIDPARVEMRAWAATPRDHLGMYADTDVALDCFPYNGTTTTCEALLMGVPVVAMEGRVHAGRVGESLLRASGLAELVAADEDGYVRIAAGLAGDRPRLAELRRTLRARLLGSALCDGKGFAARFEAALRGAWKEAIATSTARRAGDGGPGRPA